MEILEDSTYFKSPLTAEMWDIKFLMGHDNKGFYPYRWNASDSRSSSSFLKIYDSPNSPFYQGPTMWEECDNQEKWNAENYSSDKSIEEWAELEDVEAEGCFGPSLVALEEEAWDDFVFELFCHEGFDPADFYEEVK